MKTHLTKPVIEVPRKRLISNLKASDMSRLFVAFPVPDVSKLRDAVLILTTPNLNELAGFPDGVSQIDYYDKLLERFKGQKCIIKPHPRDNTDYSTLVGCDCLIDKNLPIEILNYVDGLMLDAVVTYSSTALGGVDCCRKKYVCKEGISIDGTEYLPIA